jgi:hypothetical protein
MENLHHLAKQEPSSQSRSNNKMVMGLMDMKEVEMSSCQMELEQQTQTTVKMLKFHLLTQGSLDFLKGLLLIVKIMI